MNTKEFINETDFPTIFEKLGYDSSLDSDESDDLVRFSKNVELGELKVTCDYFFSKVDEDCRNGSNVSLIKFGRNEFQLISHVTFDFESFTNDGDDLTDEQQNEINEIVIKEVSPLDCDVVSYGLVVVNLTKNQSINIDDFKIVDLNESSPFIIAAKMISDKFGRL